MALTKLLYGYLHGMSRDFFVHFSTKSCRLWKNPLFRGDISVENPQRGALTGALRSGSPAGSWHPTKSSDFAGAPHSIQPGRQSPPGSRFCPRQNAWTRHLARFPLLRLYDQVHQSVLGTPRNLPISRGPRIGLNRAGRARPVQGFAPGKTLGRATWRVFLY